MRLPHKILHLIEFLLKKRQQENGYDTTFSFKLSELNGEDLYYYNLPEVIDLLEAMKNTMVWIKTETGEDHQVRGLEDYRVNTTKKTITPIKSNTAALTSLKTKVKKETSRSIVEVDIKNRQARWSKFAWVRFYKKSLSWKVFAHIYNNYPDSVAIGDLFDNVIFPNLDERKKERLNRAGPGRTKFINDIINGIEKRLKTKKFPNNIFNRIHSKSIALNY